jgi:intermediate cleaving peptidase 55
MALTRPGMSEHQIHAILNYNVMIQGSQSLAYVPVVAGGENALTLHYVTNSQLLRDGDLVLVDAGGVCLFVISCVTMHNLTGTGIWTLRE